MIRNAAEAGEYYYNKRRLAALKGWQTRRAKALVAAPPTPTMTFGGTIVPAPAQQEDARVRA